MKKFRTVHLLYIAGGVLLFVLVLLAPNMNSESREAISNAKEAAHDHSADHPSVADDDGPDESLASIEKNSAILQLEENLASSDKTQLKLEILDSLIALSIKENIPPLVAQYTEQKAIINPTVTTWFAAGDNYFKAYRLTNGQHAVLIKKAVEAYEKVQELDPENVPAQTALGVAYVEGAQHLGVMPMKGIGILLNILEKDPTNVNVLTNLGYFAIQSGQYDKAIERFEKILEIDPQNAEAYLYLTDVYVRMGEKGKAIENLKIYKSFIDDPLAEQQVEKYMEEIRNK